METAEDPSSVRTQHRELYAKLRDDLFKRQLSNAENFDKAILQYSSAGLGFSLAFLKDFVPVSRASAGWLLYGSWGLFVGAIIATVASYVASQRAIKEQLRLGERYYLEDDMASGETPNAFARITDWLNDASGLCFVLAIIATTAFVAFNVNKESSVGDKPRIVMDGAPVPKLQKVQGPVGVEKGAPVPPLQKVPASQPPPGGGQSPPQQPHTGGQGAPRK